MEGWLLAPATEYLNVRHPLRAIATLLLGLLIVPSGLLKR
jgi:hypothetical protein